MQELSVPPVAGADLVNLTDMVWDNADRAGGVVQFARRDPDGTGWRDVTCAQFRDEVAELASGLVAAGVEPGERVGLISRTRYEWTLIDFAIWAAGGVTVPIYETSSPDQVAWILSDSGAVACFAETDAHRAAVASVRDQLPALRDVWGVEPLALTELARGGRDVEEEVLAIRRHAAGLDDIATIIYTSGTTGRPKGCVLTHRNLYADVANAVSVLSDLLHEGASTLLFLPLAHSFARLIQLGVVRSRCRMGYCPDVKDLVDELAAFQPTFLLSVPRVFEKVYNGARQRAHASGRGPIYERAERTAVAFSRALDTPAGPGLALRLRYALFDRLVYGKLRAALGGRCHAAISGGAPLGERLAHFFRGVGVTVYEGYGLTETSPAVAVNLPGAARIGTVGRPLPGVTVRIDAADGSGAGGPETAESAADQAGPGEIRAGEILVRGDLVFGGYWQDRAGTEEVLDGDGWLHTGDLGELDSDGYLRITGRKKEIIVTAGGKNVAPAGLEDRLRAHPLISQCMVVGDGRPFIAALITIDEEAWPAWLAAHGHPAGTAVADLRDDDGLRAEIQQAVDDANRSVSRAEAIKVFRILPRDWTEATGELTPSLKVRRSVVLKEHADEISAIYPG